MKANFQGLRGIKGLLLKHGEKLAIAVVILCTGALLYACLGHESLPDNKQPQNLRQLTSQASSKLDSSRWEQLSDDKKFVAHPIQGDAMNPVNPENFPNYAKGFNPHVVRPTTLRPDPPIYTIANIEVYSGSALIPFIDDEVRKKRQLEQAIEQQEKEREAEKKRAQEEDDRGGGRRGGLLGGDMIGRPGRGAGQDPIDPAHPNRRRANLRIPGGGGVALRGDEDVRVVYYATIVAPVPYKKQQKAFEEALKDAKDYDPTRDIPSYLGYYIERAEVVKGKLGKWIQIGPTAAPNKKRESPVVSRNSIAKATQAWGSRSDEVVDSRYIHPDLSYPLPPMVTGAWAAHATHTSIPLESMAARAPQRDARDAKNPAGPEQPEQEGDELLDLADDRGGVRDVGGPRGGGMRGGRGRGLLGGERRGVGGGARRGMGDMIGGGGPRGGGMGMGRGRRGGLLRRGPALGGRMFDNRDVDERLFRFVDITVKPGKIYKYRVRLVMNDVNNGVDERFLDGASAKRRSDIRQAYAGESRRAHRDMLLRIRRTDWSKSSPAVSIPLAGSILLAATKPANPQRANDEPRATLLVKSFNVKDGTETGHQADFVIGSILNLKADVWALVEKGHFVDKLPGVLFNTGMTLVDVRGGEALSRRNRELTAPARAVLMDANGRMSIRKQLDDAEDVELHRLIVEEPAPEDNFGDRMGGGRRGGRGGR